MYKAEVVCDSITQSGVRLTTMLVTFPRFILAEINTHRSMSRNSASSRAIPVERRIAQVLSNPFVPEAFGKNQRGMQSQDVIGDQEHARAVWLDARDRACDAAEQLAKLKVHKQHANRLLEPYCWHTAIVTATEWDNFFALRCHPAAQPEMQITANLMRDARATSEPQMRLAGEWHLPFVNDLSADLSTLIKVCVARCAAVSFERHGDQRKDIDEYIARHDMLAASGHWSPFEHQARVMAPEAYAKIDHQFCGNLRLPWQQYRKTFDGEAVFRG